MPVGEPLLYQLDLKRGLIFSVEQTKPLRKSIQLFVSFDLNTLGQCVSKGTISNWPSAYTAHYCTWASRGLPGPCQRSGNQSPAGGSSHPQVSLAELQPVQPSLHIYPALFPWHCCRDVRFGAHRVRDCFSTHFQTLCSFSESWCLQAFVFFKTCVTHPVPALAKSSNLGQWVTSLLEMRTNVKANKKCSARQPLVSYLLLEAYPVHTDSKMKCKAN